MVEQTLGSLWTLEEAQANLSGLQKDIAAAAGLLIQFDELYARIQQALEDAERHEAWRLLGHPSHVDYVTAAFEGATFQGKNKAHRDKMALLLRDHGARMQTIADSLGVSLGTAPTF